MPASRSSNARVESSLSAEAVLSMINSVECRVNNIAAELLAENERQKVNTASVSERLEAVVTVVDKVVLDTMHATKTASQALAMASEATSCNGGRSGVDADLAAKFKTFQAYCEEMMSAQAAVHRDHILKVTNSMNTMGTELIKEMERFGAELADQSQQLDEWRTEHRQLVKEKSDQNVELKGDDVQMLADRMSVAELHLKRMTERILATGLAQKQSDDYTALNSVLQRLSQSKDVASADVPGAANCTADISEAIQVGSRVDAQYRDTWYKGTVVGLPEDDKERRGRYSVQCDVDDEGRLTYTNNVRLRDQEFMALPTVVEDQEDLESSSKSCSTREGHQWKQRSDSLPISTTDESSAEWLVDSDKKYLAPSGSPVTSEMAVPPVPAMPPPPVAGLSSVPPLPVGLAAELLPERSSKSRELPPPVHVGRVAELSPQRGTNSQDRMIHERTQGFLSRCAPPPVDSGGDSEQALSFVAQAQARAMSERQAEAALLQRSREAKTLNQGAVPGPPLAAALRRRLALDRVRSASPPVTDTRPSSSVRSAPINSTEAPREAPRPHLPSSEMAHLGEADWQKLWQNRVLTLLEEQSARIAQLESSVWMLQACETSDE